MWKKVSLWVGGALLCSGLVLGQTALEQMVKDGEAGWVFGTWKGTTENGTEITQQIRWGLKKQVIVLRGTVGEFQFLGITSVNPLSGSVEYTGFDSRGGRSKGTWDSDGQNLILTLEATSPEGETHKVAFVFVKKGADKMDVEVHEVDQWGYPVYPAKGKVTLTKQKAPSRAHGKKGKKMQMHRMKKMQ